MKDADLSVTSAPWRKHARVVIVGGGAAGLSCAAELKLLGFKDLMVLEASPNFGGRCQTERLPDGAWYDPSAQYLGERQRPFKWAKKLGVPVIEVQDTRDMVIADNLRLSEADAEMVLERMDQDYELLIACSQLVDPTAPWNTKKIAVPVPNGKSERVIELNLDGMSALELYQALPMSTEGRAAITAFEVGTQGVALEQLSAIMHLAQYQTQGATGADDYTFEHGYGSLLDALVQFVGTERCYAETPVVKVDHLAPNRHRVVCADGRMVWAEIVVFAIPPKVRPLINSKFLANRKEVQVGGAAKVCALSRTEPDHTWCLDLSEGCLGQESWAFPSGARQGLYLFGSGESLDRFAALDRFTQANVAQARLGQVFYADRGLPNDVEIFFTDWTKVPHIGGSYTVPSPTDVETLRQHCMSDTPEHGVFIIGEDSAPKLSGANFGYSDGAFEAGETTAREIFTMLA